MSDAIDRAAEVLFRWNVRHGPYFVIGGGGHVFDTDDPYKPIAQALADAGLLVSPEHDAAVAAKTLRDTAGAAGTIKVHAGGGNLVTQVHAVSADDLRERADRIEAGEGGTDDH